MKGPKMKYPTVCFLLPFIFLLSLFPPLHAEKVGRCFVCTEKSSPKCSGQLSPSDTELIKECPVGTGINGTARGCQLIAWQTGELIHPKREFLWRDCLYLTDLNVHGFSPNENQIGGRTPSGSLIAMNERRRQLGIPLLPSCDTSVLTGPSFVELYNHPNPEYWNLSNGISIELALLTTSVNPNFNFTKLPDKGIAPCPNFHLRSGSVVCGLSVLMLLGGGLLVIICSF